MVVEIFLTSEGIIKTVAADGHAGDELSGKNIICAAATALIRTAYRTAAKNSKTVIQVEAEKPGKLFFEIKDFDKKDFYRLQGISDFLLTGLKDLETEYPGKIKIELNCKGV